MAKSLRVSCAAAVVVMAGMGAGLARGGDGGIREAKNVEVMFGGAWKTAQGVYVTGQPTEETLRALAADGLKMVICLRTARELSDRKALPFDEAALAKELAIEFVHVPLGGGMWTYSPEALARVEDALARAQGNALLHCTVGWRASLMWAAHRASRGGLPMDEAMEEARAMALGTDQIGALLGKRIEWRLTDEPMEREAGWLVDAKWLMEEGSSRDVRVLDVRPSYSAYFEGHAPGAVHLDAHALRGPSGGLPAQFRSAERMGEVFALAGVTGNERVVVYAEGGDILSATMTMYALERLGHTNTSLLNGGVEAVREAGRVEQAYGSYKPGEMRWVDVSGMTGVTLEQVRGWVGGDEVLFVDARPGEQYRGETRVWARNGHIPGAVNVHWRTLTEEENASRVRKTDELRAIFEKAGVTADKDVVVYCGTGREATLLYMALTRELGYPRVRLYEGGWTEYSAAEGSVVEP